MSTPETPQETPREPEPDVKKNRDIEIINGGLDIVKKEEEGDRKHQNEVEEIGKRPTIH